MNFNLDFIGRGFLTAIYGTMLAIAGMDIWLYSVGPLDLAARLPILILNVAAALFTIIRFPPKHDSLGWSPRIAAIAGTFAPWLLIVVPVHAAPESLRAAAAIISPLFTTFAVLCLFFLGRSFSIDAQARVLRTSGPYRIIRHPLYFCELAAFASVPIGNPSLATAALWMVTLVLQFWRMRNEERVLTKVYPEYSAYASAVPQIVPFLKLVCRPPVTVHNNRQSHAG